MSTVTGTSNTIATQLTDNYLKESASAFRITLWISFFVLLFLLISSFISRICFKACATSIVNDAKSLSYRPMRFKNKCKLLREDFKNDYEKSKFSFNYKTASKYQSVPLTPPESMQNNMMSAQANRYFSLQNEKANIIIDVFADLYILGGNIYGETSTDQEYRLYGYTVDNEKFDFGKLEKSQDGFNKLKYITDDLEILKYNRLEIVYKTTKTENVLLIGAFQSMIE